MPATCANLSGYETLGAVVREFQDRGWPCDRIPRRLDDFRLGVNVRVTKAVDARVSCHKRGGAVTVEIVAGRRVLKDGKALEDTSGFAVVQLAQRLLEEASV